MHDLKFFDGTGWTNYAWATNDWISLREKFIPWKQGYRFFIILNYSVSISVDLEMWLLLHNKPNIIPFKQETGTSRCRQTRSKEHRWHLRHSSSSFFPAFFAGHQHILLHLHEIEFGFNRINLLISGLITPWHIAVFSRVTRTVLHSPWFMFLHEVENHTTTVWTCTPPVKSPNFAQYTDTNK